ncbi:MAG TPA: hypothetical protein VIO10_03490 [Candidatus Binatus sp.]
MAKVAHKVLIISALLANLAGALLLLCGLQVSSLDDLRVAKTDDGGTAICQGPDVLYEAGGSRHNVFVGTRAKCPPISSPVAIIVSDHPRFISIGVALIIVGFFLALGDELLCRRP